MAKSDGKDKVPFYEQDNAYIKAGILSLAGCFLLLAATFLYWKNIYVKTTEVKYTGTSFINVIRMCVKSIIALDYDGGIDKVVFNVKGVVPLVLMILYFVVLIFLIAAGVNDNITRREFFVHRKKRIRVAALVIIIILMMVITHTSIYKASLEQDLNLYTRWKNSIQTLKVKNMANASNMKCYYFIGPGFISFWLGIVLYFISIIYNFILETLNEDDDETAKVLENIAEPVKTSGDVSGVEKTGAASGFDDLDISSLADSYLKEKSNKLRLK